MFYMHDTLISGFAAISFGLIALMPFLIVYDAVARTIGWQPPLWSVPFIEYALLFIVVMGAPWLLRKNGHVTIEVLSMQLSDRRRILLEKAAYMLSSLACWVTSFFGARLAYEAAKSGSYDVRSISVPETYIYSLLAFGFLASRD